MEQDHPISRFLDKEVDLLDELSAAASRFPTCAARLDLHSLADSLQAQVVVLRKLQELEQQIRQARDAMAARGGAEPTEAEGGGGAEPGEGASLRQGQQALLPRLQRLRRLNATNRKIVEGSLHHLNGELRVLLSFSENHNGYGNDGDIREDFRPVGRAEREA